MLKKTYQEGLVWFSLNGAVGLTDIADFLREMSKEINYGNKVIVLDISNSDHIQRHSFDSLINIKNKLKQSGVRLIIVCSKQLLINILKVERIPEHFEVVNDTALIKSQYAFANSYSVYKN